MKNFLISGLVDNYRIKINIFAMSPNTAIKVFSKNILKPKTFMSYRIYSKDPLRKSQKFFFTFERLLP